MKVYEVKFKSYNRLDYEEFVSAKNLKDAYRHAQKMTVKKDDRDIIKSIRIEPTKALGGYPWYQIGKKKF